MGEGRGGAFGESVDQAKGTDANLEASASCRLFPHESNLLPGQAAHLGRGPPTGLMLLLRTFSVSSIGR